MKLTSVVWIAAFFIFSSFDLPKEWYKRGSQPDNYDMGIDPNSGYGKNAATIKSNKHVEHGFGTLMQSCSAEKYRGKYVKMSGYMKTTKLGGWAGLWLRIDNVTNGDRTSIGFDNMGDRPVYKKTDWQKYEIILKVPEIATNLAYGALLYGNGQLWFTDISFEVVEQPARECNVCTPILPEAVNLDFGN